MVFKRILVPTDFSSNSKAALEMAAALAHEQGARLLIMHAAPSLGPEFLTFGEAVSQLQPETHRQRLWADLHQIKQPFPDVSVDYLLSEEDAVEAIVRAAAAHGCDLIVVSSHGRTGLRRLFMGSVAEVIVRKASCPVLVIKTAHAHPLAAEHRTDMHPHSLAENKFPNPD